MDYPDLRNEQRIGRKLAITSKVMQANFDARMAAKGGSLTTWLVLRHVRDNDRLSQKDLARIIHIEGPTLTRHLDRLEADGLLIRERDTEDRRITRVTLTSRGVALLVRLTHEANAAEDELRKVLTPSDRDQLGKILDKVYAHARAQESAWPPPPSLTPARRTPKQATRSSAPRG